MATPASSSLGKDLESLGKAFNACVMIKEIGEELKKAKEQLKSVDTSADTINVTLLPFREFKDVVKDCLRIAESLHSQEAGIAEDHSKCFEEMKNIANSGTLTNENAESMKNALTKLVEDFERFGRDLDEFVERIKKLQRVSERVKDETPREEETVRKEAASTRSEADWNNFYQWMELITTFGLITQTSYYQASVDANKRRYDRAEELDKLFQKFEKARQLLDVALRTINGVGKRIGSRPVQLTKEVIQLIQSVLLQYQKIAEAQQQALQAQKKSIEAEEKAAITEQEVAELKKKEAEAQAENERLRRELEELKKNQGK
uniref:RPW8 domain-containing protein n=1 Tax=Macrostomum lignano TaxID=282301 RepID=A0A1I8J5V1_9PLAT